MHLNMNNEKGCWLEKVASMSGEKHLYTGVEGAFKAVDPCPGVKEKSANLLSEISYATETS